MDSYPEFLRIYAWPARNSDSSEGQLEFRLGTQKLPANRFRVGWVLMMELPRVLSDMRASRAVRHALSHQCHNVIE
jgi:hypothetical protein